MILCNYYEFMNQINLGINFRYFIFSYMNLDKLLYGFEYEEFFYFFKEKVENFFYLLELYKFLGIQMK